MTRPLAEAAVSWPGARGAFFRASRHPLRCWPRSPCKVTSGSHEGELQLRLGTCRRRTSPRGAWRERRHTEGRIVLNQYNRPFVFPCCCVSFALILFLFRCGQSQEEQIKRSVEPSPDKAAVVKALGGR